MSAQRDERSESFAGGDARAKRAFGSGEARERSERGAEPTREMVRDLKHNPWKFLWRE